jgi:hypothetical protein
MQIFLLFVLSFEHVNFAMNGKYSKNNYDNPNYYVSLHNLTNIQKMNFKECPFIWVTPLIVNFLPIGTFQNIPYTLC